MGWHVGLMYCSMEGKHSSLLVNIKPNQILVILVELLLLSVDLTQSHQFTVLCKGGLPLLLVHPQPIGTSYDVFSLSQFMSWQGKKLPAGFI
jgi:hypothetical protein